jgi:hypothetical protein
MQKTQNFSCLFRHYAKHNGLSKEGCTYSINNETFIIILQQLDLIFTFVDELQNDQTPESVHLMPQGNTNLLC